ncbi:hypothetical protein ACHAPT_008319 [Fusarium lateritium]
MNHRAADIKLPSTGTFEWLFQHQKWKHWLTCHGGLMWIKGKPGSGKSTLLRYAERELNKTRVNKKDLVLSFFFHGRGEKLETSPLGMYRSLPCQILAQEPSSLSKLVEMFKNEWDGKGDADAILEQDVEHLGNHLDWAIDDISKNRTIWLFVDALDECGQDGAQEVLRSFNNLRRPGVFICVSCRHYPIRNWDGRFEIRVEEQNYPDIIRYAQNHLSHLKDTTTLSIPDFIATNSSGVFIWARLVVERLSRMQIGVDGEEAEDLIKRTIESIPQGIDDLYAGIVQDIEKTPIALSLLRWVWFAKRRLTPAELLAAAMVDPGAHPESYHGAGEEWPRSYKEVEMKVKTLGRGLLEIVPYGQYVVQFIHQTVVDFFNKGDLLLPNGKEGSANPGIDTANDHCFRTCVTYLKMYVVAYQQGARHPSDFPFLEYATQFWVEHAGSSQKSQANLLDVLGWSSNHFVGSWAWLYRNSNRQDSLDCPPPGIELAHVVARYGWTKPLSIML